MISKWNTKLKYKIEFKFINPQIWDAINSFYTENSNRPYFLRLRLYDYRIFYKVVLSDYYETVFQNKKELSFLKVKYNFVPRGEVIVFPHGVRFPLSLYWFLAGDLRLKSGKVF